jgi:hypothetical protein
MPRWQPRQPRRPDFRHPAAPASPPPGHPRPETPPRWSRPCSPLASRWRLHHNLRNAAWPSRSRYRRRSPSRSGKSRVPGGREFPDARAAPISRSNSTMWLGSRPRRVPLPLPMQTSPVGRQEGSDSGTHPRWRPCLTDEGGRPVPIRPRPSVRDPRRSGWSPGIVGVRRAAARGPAVCGDPLWTDVGRRLPWSPRLHRRLPPGRSLSAPPATVMCSGWRSPRRRLPHRPPPCRPLASLPMSMSDTAERPSSSGAAVPRPPGWRPRPSPTTS